MDRTTFPWATVGGYDFYEVLSALQKTIRRGLRDDALFWATELYLSGYETHAWRRFLIIACEDIGIANRNTFVEIRALWLTWLERKKEDDAKLYFVDALLRLIESAKCRITDHATITFFEGERIPLEIPDYALDVHTDRGRAKGRGYKHFFEEGATLESVTLPDPYEKRAKAIREKR